MSNSKDIAGLIGPTLIAAAISEAMNLHIWANNIAPVTYLDGCCWPFNRPCSQSLDGWLALQLEFYWPTRPTLEVAQHLNDEASGLRVTAPFGSSATDVRAGVDTK